MSASNSDSESGRSLTGWTLVDGASANDSQKSDSDASSTFVELDTSNTVKYGRKSKQPLTHESSGSISAVEDISAEVHALSVNVEPPQAGMSSSTKGSFLPNDDGGIFEEDSDGYNYDFAYPDRIGGNPEELSEDPDFSYSQMLRQEAAEEDDSDSSSSSQDTSEVPLDRSRSSFEELNVEERDSKNSSPEILQPLSDTSAEDDDGANNNLSDHGGAVAGPSKVVRPPLGLDRALCDRLRPETSESDHSDYVKLEYGASVDENDADDEEPFLMHASTGSSSVSSGFRFFRPLKLPVGTNYRMIYKDDDVESLPDVMEDDDSDGSGVAGDESDLSNMAYNINELQLSADNVPRSYRHNPNQGLNAVLTVVAVVSVCLAIGVGMGHYMGTQKVVNLYKQRLTKKKKVPTATLR